MRSSYRGDELVDVLLERDDGISETAL